MARISTSQRQFRVLIEQDGDGYLVASVPGLPGCHTQARTLPELHERVRDAIRLCLKIAETNVQYRQRISRFSYEPTFVGMELVTV